MGIQRAIVDRKSTVVVDGEMFHVAPLHYLR